MAEQLREKRFFYVNSGNALSSTTNQFSTILQIPTDKHFDKVTVLQVALPISYYLVQQGYNQFILMENSTKVTISVIPGNYNLNSFCAIVSSLLNANSPNGLKYTMTFANSFTQPETGLINYSVNSSTVSCSLIFLSANPLNEQFGFSTGSTNVFLAGSSSSTLTSQNVCSFVPENTIFINSNLVGGDQGNDSILQEVYNQNQIPFSFIAWTNPDPLTYCKTLSTSRNQSVSFSFVNEAGIPLYFNGVNVAITVCIFRSNNFYAKAESFIKFLAMKEHEAGDLSLPETPGFPNGEQNDQILS